MARQQVSYAELVESVMAQQLPAGRTLPIMVELLETKQPSTTVTLAAFAEYVATLLLTTRPVCILGAEQVTAQERLQFVDRVLSLLPYGLRARLSASTWASATIQNLKLRLFFSDHERLDGGVTLHATWGRAVRLDLSSSGAAPLQNYANWLEHRPAGAATELASQTDPVRFDADEIQQLIGNLPRDWPAGDVLEALAAGLRSGELPVAQAAVRRLRRLSAGSTGVEERKTYLQEIKRLGLFRDYPGLPTAIKASVYRALLSLAFRRELSYLDFCEIEACVGGPPSGVLARQTGKLSFEGYIPWLLTLKSATDLTDRELMASLREQGMEPAAPLTDFTGSIDSVQPAHRAVALDFAVGYLCAYSADPATELAERGYLAKTLEQVFPRDRQAQRARLRQMLAFAYGKELSKEAAAELLTRPKGLRTLALDEAVGELTSRPPTATILGTPQARVLFLFALAVGILVFLVLDVVLIHFPG
jgi:hypothetical protein